MRPSAAGVLALALVALTASGCLSPTDGASWRDLGCDGVGGEPGGHTADDSASFDVLWSGACMGDPPQVDFSEEQVVAYFWGEKPSGGYQVRVVRVVEGPPHEVVVERVRPGDDCGTASVLTYPAVVVALPLEGAVSFTVEDRVRHCG